MEAPAWIRSNPTGVSVEVHVQPGARRSCSAGLFDGVPKVRIAAHPREDAANSELLQWLASMLDVPRSRIHLAAGHRSRRKRVAIEGNPATLIRSLTALLDPHAT